MGVNTWELLMGILLPLAVLVVGLAVGYVVIKAAVRQGVREALQAERERDLLPPRS